MTDSIDEGSVEIIEQTENLGTTESEGSAEQSQESQGESQVTQESSVESEKMIPSSEVNRIVRKRLREAQEKANREFQEQQAAANRNTMQQQANKPFAEMTPEEQGRYLDYHAEQRALRKEIDSTVSSFLGKIRAEVEQDPDFQDVYEDLQLGSSPQLASLAALANKFDNTTDILRDLHNNPRNLVDITGLISVGNEKLAEKQLLKLSQSIKANNQAKSSKKAPEPLSQIKPSNLTVGGSNDDWGSLRNHPSLRG